jgi:lipid-A-disaccharide synthase
MDYPEFNIALAAAAKRYKVPVLYYIGPQIWAWRTGRIRKIARRVDRMAVILPFEEPFYRERGVHVDYVGHPLLDSFPGHTERYDATQKMQFVNGYPILALVPGSRSEEVKNLLPVMLKAAEILSSRYPKVRCILPMASTVHPELVRSIIERSPLSVKISEGDIYKALGPCDLAFVTSGTATLETAIMGVPMIVVYRLSPFTFWVAEKVVKVPYVGLVNLVLPGQVAPELLQDDLTPQSLADEAVNILENHQKREDMIRKLRMVSEKLGKGGASEQTARIAMEMITG